MNSILCNRNTCFRLWATLHIKPHANLQLWRRAMCCQKLPLWSSKNKSPTKCNINIVLDTFGLPSVSFFNDHSYVYTIVFLERVESAARETTRATAIIAAAADTTTRAGPSSGMDCCSWLSPGMGCRQHADRRPVSSAAAAVSNLNFQESASRAQRPLELSISHTGITYIAVKYFPICTLYPR